MDAVFKQLDYEPLKHERVAPAARSLDHRQRVLVTGGTGFVGKRLVKRLVADGYAVRVLARKLSNVAELQALGAEVFWGDVADLTSFDEAFAGCDIVVHLAAGTSGTEKDSRTGTLQGTQNLLDLCAKHRPKRLVYISSCSVYGIADCRKNALVSETSPLERFPDRRGSYSASKQEAERCVAEYMKTGGVPVVILRPGTIYGPGGDLYTPMIGFSFGSRYIVIGSGRFVLPLVYVDNVVDAIGRAMTTKEAEGEVFNVVDPDPLTKRAYMDAVVRRVHRGASVLYLPYSILYAITWLQEIVFGFMGRRPVLTRYRLTASQRNVVYDSSKIRTRLGWAPPVDRKDALDRLVASEQSRQGGDAAVAPEDDASRAA